MSLNLSQSSAWSCLSPGQFATGTPVPGHLIWPGATLQQVVANAVSVADQTPAFRFRLMQDGVASALSLTVPVGTGACTSPWLDPNLTLGDEWLTWEEEEGPEDERASDLVIHAMVAPPASGQVIVPVQQVSQIAAGDFLHGGAHHAAALAVDRVSIRGLGPESVGTQLQLVSAPRPPSNPIGYESPLTYSVLDTWTVDPPDQGAWHASNTELTGVTVPAGHLVRVRCSAVPATPTHAPTHLSVVIYGTLQGS